MSKDKLLQLVTAYLEAYSQKDADGCARAFTSDGASFSPYGPPATGRQAIADTHKKWFEEPEEDKQIEVLEFELEGESGFCLLRWSAKVPDETDASGYSITAGVSLCVLKLEENELLFSRLALVPESV